MSLTRRAFIGTGVALVGAAAAPGFPESPSPLAHLPPRADYHKQRHVDPRYFSGRGR